LQVKYLHLPFLIVLHYAAG